MLGNYILINIFHLNKIFFKQFFLNKNNFLNWLNLEFEIEWKKHNIIIKTEEIISLYNELKKWFIIQTIKKNDFIIEIIFWIP